jgi:hypothetical protein
MRPVLAVAAVAALVACLRTAMPGDRDPDGAGKRVHIEVATRHCRVVAATSPLQIRARCD